MPQAAWNDRISQVQMERLESRLLLSATEPLTFDATHPATFFDADGDAVTVTLTGPGVGRVFYETVGVNGVAPLCQIKGIDVTGTTGASALAVKVKRVGGTGTTTVGTISTGAIKSITAPTTDLLGIFTDGGTGLLAINATDPSKPTLAPTVSLGVIEDATFFSALPIKSLTTVAWFHNVFPPDNLTAPSIGTLKTTGRKALGAAPAVPGYFGAEVNLTPALGPGAPALGTATITGGLGTCVWNLGGTLGTLKVSGQTESFTLQSTSAANSLLFGEVGSLDINAGPIKSLSSRSWPAGTLQSPAVGSLAILGNIGEYVYFAPDSIGTLTVGGVCNGAGWISGDVKSIKMGSLDSDLQIGGNVGSVTLGNLGGELDIFGDAPKVTIKTPMALLSPVGGEIGRLSIGGVGTVRTAGETVKMNGGELYSATPSLYRLEDLRHYDRPGSWWTYDVAANSAGERFTDTTTVSVNNGGTTPGGEPIYSVTATSGQGPDLTTNWYTDALGTHIDGWATTFSAGWSRLTLDLNIDSALMAPQYLELKKVTKGSGVVSGSISGRVAGQGINGTVTGKATVSSTLAGHEIIPLGTQDCLAAKVVCNLTFSGSMVINVAGETVTANFTSKQDQTWWATPNTGPIKIVDSLTLTIRVAGYGTVSESIKQTALTTSFGDGSSTTTFA